jgi:hypothetical protein
MSASTRDPRPAEDEAARVSLPIRWFSGPAVRLHAAMLAGVALAGAATWLEWTRAREGHAIAWVYTFEWPLFALLGLYLWWRLLHPHARPGPPPGPATDAGDSRARPDPELLAWQAYLARLHEVDPPGGPPAGRR